MFRNLIYNFIIRWFYCSSFFIKAAQRTYYLSYIRRPWRRKSQIWYHTTGVPLEWSSGCFNIVLINKTFSSQRKQQKQTPKNKISRFTTYDNEGKTWAILSFSHSSANGVKFSTLCDYSW